jgi:hypothetical protein
MQSFQAPFFNLTFEGSFLHIEKPRAAGIQGEDNLRPILLKNSSR